MSGIVGAEYLVSIGEESDPTSKVRTFREIIVQEFR